MLVMSMPTVQMYLEVSLANARQDMKAMENHAVRFQRSDSDRISV